MLAERIEEWTRRWKEEGREEGRQEGREEGRREALLTLIERQLELRFGPLPEAIRGRLEGADADTLLHWADRVLTADTLEAVFE